jgi:hypothetical protein
VIEDPFDKRRDRENLVVAMLLIGYAVCACAALWLSLFYGSEGMWSIAALVVFLTFVELYPLTEKDNEISKRRIAAMDREIRIREGQLARELEELAKDDGPERKD